MRIGCSRCRSRRFSCRWRRSLAIIESPTLVIGQSTVQLVHKLCARASKGQVAGQTARPFFACAEVRPPFSCAVQDLGYRKAGRRIFYSKELDRLRRWRLTHNSVRRRLFVRIAACVALVYHGGHGFGLLGAVSSNGNVEGICSFVGLVADQFAFKRCCGGCAGRCCER